MFTSILNSTTGSLSIITALICTGVSLILGLIIAIIYMLQGKYSKNFVLTLVILPAIVQMVIMLVNGNLGAGIAVMGAFSLIRFRSVPGSSKDITCIFLAMGIGLATGMGYITFAVIATTIIGLTFLLLSKINFGERKVLEKQLKVIIPEDLDYTEVFDDIFEKYTKSFSLEKVKTTNLGSMFELVYLISIKENVSEKEMIDAIRCRNGNLTIILNKPVSDFQEL